MFRLGLAMLLLLGCQRHESGVSVRPGDSLLDLIEHVQVEQHPPTELPTDVAVPGRRVKGVGKVVIAAEEWSRARALPERYRDLLGMSGSTYVWKTARLITMDADAGTFRLLHDGRVVAPVSDWGKARWWDEQAQCTFWWDYDGQSLLALSDDAPGQVSIEAQGAEAEPPAPPEAPWAQPQAADLVYRMRGDQRSLPCLVTPAPSILRVDVDVFGGDELALVTEVSEGAYRRNGDHIERGSSPAASVLFALDATVDGRTRRLWEHRVQPNALAEEHEIPLESLRGKAVTLRLVTEVEPAADGAVHYAFWGKLRVSGPVERPPARPHVVIIDIDTLRADRLGCYGASRNTSPRLDAWAERQAVVYRDTTSPGNWTLPATVSMLTGLAVHQHGIESFPSSVTEQARPLALSLKGAGYETRALTEGGYVSAVFGFDLGFDEFRSGPYHDPDWSATLDWLRGRRSERPFFLFLHTYMVHAPLAHDDRFEDPGAPYDGWLLDQAIDHKTLAVPLRKGEIEVDERDRAYVRRLYDAGVARMDAFVGAFLDELDAILGDAPRLVIFTSDHGEEYWDHGDMGHGQSLHGELINVPLIVRFPEGAPVGVSATPASVLDIVPTVLDVAGLPADLNLPGDSLRETLPGQRLRVSQHPIHGQAVDYAGFKLIRGPTPADRALFDLASDPGEHIDLMAEQGERAELLEQRLETFLQTWRSVEQAADPGMLVDPDTIEQLKALGYLDG